MICKNCEHRIIKVSKEEQKEHDVHEYSHGTSKKSFIVYPLDSCHKQGCICQEPSPSTGKVQK